MALHTPSRSALALALGLLIAGSAAAQSVVPDTAAHDKALQAARADLARATARIAALSGQPAGSGIRKIQIQRQATRKPVIGVLLAPDAQAGVRITGITPDGSAAKAGLKAGDRLVSVNGQSVLGSNGELRLANLRKLLEQLDDETEAKIGYARDGRTAVVNVTPTLDQRVYVWDIDDDGKGSLMKFEGNVAIRPAAGSNIVMQADRVDVDATPGVPPEIRREIDINRRDGCEGHACWSINMPALMSAFRWKGLNLASVDPQLGRYFGTDYGVLVLSNGGLAGLQAGDVIQAINGKAVASPRDAMTVLGNQPGGTRVDVAYMRDRKTGSAQLRVPRMGTYPPPPPSPPAPPPPPPPPAPMPKTAFESGEVVVQHRIATLAPLAAPAPPSADLGAID